MKAAPWVLLSLFPALLAVHLPAPGQDKKKPEKKAEPRVTVVIPLGAAPGKTSNLTVRGFQLDTATALRFETVKAAVKIVSKGKAPVPDKNPDKVGDTQLVVEVMLPADVSDGPLPFTVATPAGVTKPHALLIESKRPVIPEKEPNDGFRQAQPIQIPQVIEGVIERSRDVDVFRFEGKSGQRLRLEVLAGHHGSALDSILTLYDARGQEIASGDDADGSLDSRIEVRLSRDGTYYIGLIDAHDTGGPVHVYRLAVHPGK
ncbi:MAG: PPC domain-containing protein [Gemmataceae bacterium]|nr:PPC domain-containing protein [Gemmataceae bacterium]